MEYTQCYKVGGCGIYEGLSCEECPASKLDYNLPAGSYLTELERDFCSKMGATYVTRNFTTLIFFWKEKPDYDKLYGFHKENACLGMLTLQPDSKIFEHIDRDTCVAVEETE